jgi:hypothetical protein
MRRTLTDEPSEALALPRPAAARVIGLSTRSLDRLIRAGAISTVPAFRRRLIPVKELKRFIAEGGYDKKQRSDVTSKQALVQG